MSPTLVDTHAHLDGPEFTSDLEQTVTRAKDAGVKTIVSAGQDQATSRATLDIAARFAGVAPAVGVHPHLAKDAGDLNWLLPLLDDPRIVAAGEMGLDYHYDFSPRDRQREVFARQLEWASERDLSAIVHCREAYDDVMEMLSKHRKRRIPVVIHCFTASYDVGRQFIDEFDAYLGIGGAVTFKKATDLHDAVKRLPLEHLVLETDCPYMTPTPYRGKRNEPAFMTLTRDAVASLRKVTAESITEVTTANALRLFPRLATRSARST